MTREEQIEQYCKEQGCPAGACASQLVFQHNIIYAAIKWADNHPVIKEDDYVGMGFPEVQEYMESPRWSEVGFDADKNLWFIPKDMIKNE